MTEIHPTNEPPVFLDSVLNPHCSLPPRAFVGIMAVLAALSLIAGAICLLVGAWPIFGFFGLDVLLVYVAFKVSYRRARQHERIRLTDRDLTVDRVSVRGERRQWQFEPTWLRVSVDETDARSPLILGSHGRSVIVGSFLGPSERLSFAATLKDALRKWRAFVANASNRG
jgi:uncharacterized membrane protein